MKNSIDPAIAKKLIEKFQKQFGKPDRKVDNFDLPNSVRISRKDIEAILADETVENLLIYFSIGELEDKRQFLNVIATGLKKSANDEELEAPEDPTVEYAEGGCPCPVLKSCC